MAFAGTASGPDYAAAWQLAAVDGLQQCQRPADVAVAWLFAHAQAEARSSWLQGRRDPPLEVAASDASWATQAWDTLAHRHVFRIQAHVAQVLTRWQRGEVDLRLTDAMPSPDQLLRGQSQGWRWLSLLPPDADCGLEPTPFAFALHDLCHAAHYFDPAHHRAQRGFFAAVWKATQTPGFGEWMVQFDADVPAEFRKVCADMNGSVLFLWTALRKKVTNAAKLAGRPPQDAAAELCAWLGLAGSVRDAALRFSVHRDADRALALTDAQVLENWWTAAS